MLTASQAFLSHLLDYAGLFPPAKLTLEKSLSNYLDYRRESPQAWLLGRFVCPTVRLHEVPALVPEPEDAAHLHITALGQQSRSVEQFLPQLDADLRLVEDFRRGWGRLRAVDLIEVALPKDAHALGAVLEQVQPRLQAANVRGFFEVPLQPSWPTLIEQISKILGAMKPFAGLKLRCGGLTADAFPSAEQIAHFIVCCRDAGLPWKATAGLHHPYPFWDESLQVWQHGFLNVFGAGVLALSQPLCAADLVEILVDREGAHFQINAESFAWKEWTCSLDQLLDARHQALAFGTCSFEEPCAELLALGLI